MRIESYSYNDFKKIISHKQITDTLRDLFSNVCNFYLNINKDRYTQKVVYEIDDLDPATNTPISSETEEAKITYSQFGIYFKSLVQLNNNSIEMLSTDRKYIIFIGNVNNSDKVDEDLLKSEVTSAVKTYLPSEAVPSWYVDLRTYTDYNQVLRTRNIIRELYPDINSMINYVNLKKSFIRDETLEKEINEQFMIYPTMVRKDIDAAVSKIANIYYTTNLDTANVFIEELDNIGKSLTDDDFIVYTGLEQDIYIYCAVYLTYFYKANCFIPESKHDMFLTIIMEQYYDNNAMLIEDKVDYLLNYPTFSFTVTDYTLGYLGTARAELKGAVQLCSLNCSPMSGISVDDIKKDNVVRLSKYNFKTANLLSIFDFFKINSTDVEEAKREESKLLRVLTKFESVLQINKNKLLTIFDIFVVELAGELQLGYVENLSFITDSSLFATCLKTANNAGALHPKYSVTFDNMHRFYPMEILKDGAIAIKEFISADYRFDTPERQRRRNAKKISNIKVKAPLKFASKYAIPLRYMSKNISGIPLVLSNQNELYYELGVYSPSCYALRTTTTDVLLSNLKVETLRQEPQALSAFGGFHPLRAIQLYIDENTLKNRG